MINVKEKKVETIKMKIGQKEIAFEPGPDGSFRAVCDCTALNRKVTVDLTRDQGREILSKSRRSIQEVLSNLDHRIREIFVSGLTPAEFDLAFLGRLRANKVYAGLGYDLDGL